MAELERLSKSLDMELPVVFEELYKKTDGVIWMYEYQTLALQHNRVVALPAAFAELSALTDLSLSHNKLADAAAIASLSALRQLGLSHNKLRALPDLDALHDLRSLGVSHNELDSLPVSLLRRPHLASLCASHNKIGPRLPSLAALGSLTALDLQHNQLRTAPRSLLALPSLRQLQLAGNPLPEPEQRGAAEEIVSRVREEVAAREATRARSG